MSISAQTPSYEAQRRARLLALREIARRRRLDLLDRDRWGQAVSPGPIVMTVTPWVIDTATGILTRYVFAAGTVIEGGI